MQPVPLFFLLLIVAHVVICIRIVNRFTRLENLIRESGADVDVALKRRHDLIPNLVETVKGYIDFEEQIVSRVVEARNQAASGGAAEEAELTSSLNGLLTQVQSFPELKASSTFVQLEQEIVDSEDRIAAARRFFNMNVREYNTFIRSFPASLIAGGRKPKDYLEFEDGNGRTAHPRPKPMSEFS